MTRLLATLILLAACLTGCGNASASTLTVLASWTDDEGAAFQKVLAGFTARTGIEVRYQGTRAVGQVLAADVQTGNPPDVAVLPNPGELVKYVRSHDLQPLDDVLGRPPADLYNPQWLRLQTAGQAHLYGVAVKADLKSIIWYNPSRLGSPRPRTWQELLDLSRSAGSTPWCLGLGATPVSGWPGTDWIEDILLHQSGPDTYRQWAAGRLEWTSPQVRQAWTSWGTVLAETLRDGPAPALLTDFSDAGRGMFTQGPRSCALEHNGSFMMARYGQFASPAPVPGRDFDFFPMPGTDPATADLYEVSADLAAMFTDSPQAKALMAYLASAEGQEIWPSVSGGSAFSTNRNANLDVYGDNQVARLVAETLRGGNRLCFDASDLMPATMTDAFQRAAGEFVNDPSRVDTLLAELDQIRAGITPDEWLSVSCGQ
jgi:alpha-glucoside transport system substrate-binding protein